MNHTYGIPDEAKLFMVTEVRTVVRPGVRRSIDWEWTQRTFWGDKMYFFFPLFKYC